MALNNLKFLFYSVFSGHTKLAPERKNWLLDSDSESSIAPKPVIEITSNKITYFWRLDKGNLEQEYIKNGKSMAQIAREKGCARSTVSSTISSWGLEVASQKPQYHRGQLAFGERVEKGKVVPHKAELRILDDIRDRRNEGASFGQIADWLNSQKIPTYR